MSLFERKCAVCKAPIVGRKDRKTCSDRCRTALKRAEEAAAAVTSRAETVTTAQGSVTHSGWAADEPDDVAGHWQLVEEEETPWY